MWRDFVGEVDRRIYVRKNKTVEQRSAGKFFSHFYSGIESVLKDGQHAGKKIRITKQKLYIEQGDDLLVLMGFEETMDSDRYKVTPSMPVASRLVSRPW